MKKVGLIIGIILACFCIGNNVQALSSVPNINEFWANASGTEIKDALNDYWNHDPLYDPCTVVNHEANLYNCYINFVGVADQHESRVEFVYHSPDSTSSTGVFRVSGTGYTGSQGLLYANLLNSGQFEICESASCDAIKAWATNTTYAISMSVDSNDGIFTVGFAGSSHEKSYSGHFSGLYFREYGEATTTAAGTVDNIHIYLEEEATTTTEVPFVITFGETGFSPWEPTDCKYTTTTYDTTTIYFDIYGQFSNATDSLYTYNDVRIDFYDSNGYATSYDIDNGTLIHPGDAIGWSDSLELPIGNYRLEYIAEGYDDSWEVAPIIKEYCSGTGVGWTIPTDAFNWWGTSGYLKCQSAYDDCIASSTHTALVGFLEEMMCGLKGFFISIYCPSTSTMVQVMGNIQDLQTRVPFNYAKIIRTSLETLASSTATSTATTSYMTFDLTSWSRFGELQMLSTIRDILKYIIIFIGALYIIKMGLRFMK